MLETEDMQKWSNFFKWHLSIYNLPFVESPSYIRCVVCHLIYRNRYWLLLWEQEEAGVHFLFKSIDYTTARWLFLNIALKGSPTYWTRSTVRPFMAQAHPASNPFGFTSLPSIYAPANMGWSPFDHYLPYLPPTSFLLEKFHGLIFPLFNTPTSLNPISTQELPLGLPNSAWYNSLGNSHVTWIKLCIKILKIQQ